MGKDPKTDIPAQRGTAHCSHGEGTTQESRGQEGEFSNQFAMDKEKHGVRSWCKENFNISQPEADIILENRCKHAGIPEGVFPWSCST